MVFTTIYKGEDLEREILFCLLCHFVGKEVSRNDRGDTCQLLLAASFLAILNDLKKGVGKINDIFDTKMNSMGSMHTK